MPLCTPDDGPVRPVDVHYCDYYKVSVPVGLKSNSCSIMHGMETVTIQKSLWWSPWFLCFFVCTFSLLSTVICYKTFRLHVATNFFCSFVLWPKLWVTSNPFAVSVFAVQSRCCTHIYSYITRHRISLRANKLWSHRPDVVTVQPKRVAWSWSCKVVMTE
jgi:hypothetical protein